jgi:hypothetical protein
MSDKDGDGLKMIKLCGMKGKLYTVSCRLVKGKSATRFSISGFLHGSVSPKPLILHLGSFQIFSKICGDIRSSMCTTSVVDTGGKWKKSLVRKVFIISFDIFG